MLNIAKTKIATVLLLSTVALLLIYEQTYSETSEPIASEYGLKAAYLEKILDYVQWPESSANRSTDVFEIVILGDNPFGTILENIFRDRQVNGNSIEIRYLTKLSAINTPDVLFVANSETDQLSNILKAIKGKPVFLVGDTEGYCENGVFFNFYKEAEYLRFELNEQALKAAGFSVSFHLVRIARIVNVLEED
jgi:YfiR/HmsC-like